MGVARNMKSMWSPLGAIFFMTYFYRVGWGAWPPHPPDPLLHISESVTSFSNIFISLHTHSEETTAVSPEDNVSY